MSFQKVADLLQQLDRSIWIQTLEKTMYLYWTKKVYQENQSFW